MKKITPDELKVFLEYVHKISGISIDDKKAYLLESRLARLLQQEGCNSFKQLYLKAVSPGGKGVERKIIDAITTRETLFFRDRSPFEMLQYKILPDLIDRRVAGLDDSSIASIRIWSAACSTGQEIYSIAIVLKELLGDLEKYSIRLLGTDISDAAIAYASYGQYSKIEVERGLQKAQLLKYFDPNGSGWRIKDEIRAITMFKRMNIMEPFRGLGRFDIIFCRNLLIYFNLEDRKEILDKIADVLENDGYLILGSSETLMGVSSRFRPHRYLRSVFYQLTN
ncbi:MAG: protein-glutamate O-methyltransferase CheR [Deltaproteobacteria bacterium]|nr:protein-glutamate O-methyltransferase CheR [Deltaproteobacteria bacterium]MBW2152919.1 protein-glutamate O-methyltransferase CheR [Deltaproteobacteria bacterium]